MARRWTPRRFIVQRRVRVALCAILTVVAMTITFGLTAHKSVSLSVNGQTRTINTYAYSVDGLLKQAGVKVKTHDLVDSTSGGQLRNHDVVTVRSAYQTTINIQGQQVAFWTTATSVNQLLGFFEANQRNAMKVTVDVKNVYNQLTGGLVINQEGPVTVIADGKSSVAPNGKLPAASILDSKGIVLGKDDRVSVEKDQDTTVLRVRRVTHGETVRSTPLAFGIRTVIDPNLAPGQIEIRQQGVDGEKQETIQVTYVDGEAESESVVKEETVSMPIDQVVAIGPDKQETKPDQGKTDDGDKGKNKDKNQEKNESKQDSDQDKPTQPTTPPQTSRPTEPAQPTQNPQPAQPPEPVRPPAPPTPTPPTPPTPSSGLWHASPEAAMTYAAGAAAQRGWVGSQFDDLVKLWNRESRWLWYAENQYSGAYGIPQSLPGSKMASAGAAWRDDAAVQIDWGLSYIAGRYGNPSGAWRHSEQTGWY